MSSDPILCKAEKASLLNPLPRGAGRSCSGKSVSVIMIIIMIIMNIIFIIIVINIIKQNLCVAADNQVASSLLIFLCFQLKTRPSKMDVAPWNYMEHLE